MKKPWKVQKKYIVKGQGFHNLHRYVTDDSKERLSMTDDYGKMGCGVFKQGYKLRKIFA